MRSPIVTCVLMIIVCSCAVAPGRAADVSGRWRGTWTTFSQGEARPHQGTLRVRLRPQGDGSYRGTFAGRFAGVVPYFYRATVYQQGHTLTSTKRLGPFGDYSMQLHYQPDSLNGTWSAGGSAGAIRHRPCSGVPSSAAKQAPESKRGKQSQSMDPSRLTRAAVWQSPMSA